MRNPWTMAVVNGLRDNGCHLARDDPSPQEACLLAARDPELKFVSMSGGGRAHVSVNKHPAAGLRRFVTCQSLAIRTENRILRARLCTVSN